MNISAPFIHRPIMTFLVMIAILFFGIISFKKLPVSDLPNVDYPTISVGAGYPGADPKTMANNIATPLEKQFMTIDGIKTITSSSSTGSVSISLEFDLDKSMVEAVQDVQAMINQTMPQLPRDLPFTPSYSKSNSADSPILYYALTSDSMSLSELRDYAKNVFAQQINIVKGVSQVQVFGADWAVRIQLDPQKLTAKNMTLDEVGSAIRNSIPSQPTGLLYGPKREYTIFVKGQIFDADTYNNLIIKTKDDAVVRLKDIGNAFDSLSNDKFYLSFSEKGVSRPAIVMSVKKQPGENAMAVINGIKAVLPQVKKQLPSSIRLHTILDKTTFIQESVDDVEMTLIIAFILVVTVIFIYIGRAMNTLIPTLALPMAIIGTFAIMYIFGFTIDILSLLAITLSIGFLVDDAIVVLENIVRHVEAGEHPFKAALSGSKEISVTILSMTLCLATVFFPMAFLGGVIGKLFREFSIVIISAVLISGFISLSLTPMLCSRLIPPQKPDEKKGIVERFSIKLNHFLVRHYKTTLEWALRHRKTVLGAAIASLGLTIYLFQTLPKDFLPGDDIGLIQGFSQTQDGTSPYEMIELQKEATNLIKDNPAFQSITSLGAIPGDNQGIFFIALKSPKERLPIQEVINSIYAKTLTIPGLQAFFKSTPLINLGLGSAKGDYEFTLQSLDTEILYATAPAFIEHMQTLPGFRQVSSDMHLSQPQLVLEIDRDRASYMGVDASAIESALGTAYGGGNLATINKPDGQYYVIIELLPEFSNDPKDLSKLFVRSTTSQELIRLDTLVTISETVGPLSVNHLNGIPAVTASFNLKDIPLSTALDEINTLANNTLPSNVSGSVQGTADVFETSFANLTFLLLITIFIIYVVLGILYENFFHPITVMSTLPPAAFGGLLVLFVTGNTFSLYAFVGIIMLLGIVLKNGIILVDFANVSITHKQMSPHDAIYHAALTRFRPILMTTIAALMGAVPIALGIGGVTAEGKRPLGLVVVGGLIISQILTLYFTPVVYIYLETFKEWLFKKKDQTPTA